jgi:hypothetical protein
MGERVFARLEPSGFRFILRDVRYGQRIMRCRERALLSSDAINVSYAHDIGNSLLVPNPHGYAPD